MQPDLSVNYTPGLSVVIATLGGDCLELTIKSILSGTKIPEEILICIPSGYEDSVSYLKSGKVIIIVTDKMGQVNQRTTGFQKASYDFVLQLDDDIILEKDTIKSLTEMLLQLGPGNAIGPLYYDSQTQKCIHKIPTGTAGFFKNNFDCIFCAAPWGIRKMGKVTSIGINYGIDDLYCTTNPVKTEWLPGGCVLSYHKDLILQAFFPFEGKAYCEDIYHSYYRSIAKIKSWVNTEVKVFIEEPKPAFEITTVKKVISIRRFYLKLTHGPQWRLYPYEFFCIIRSRMNDFFGKRKDEYGY